MGKDKHEATRRGAPSKKSDRATRRPKERGRAPGPVPAPTIPPGTPWFPDKPAPADAPELPRPAPTATLPTTTEPLAPATRTIKETRQAKLARQNACEVRLQRDLLEEMAGLTGERPDEPSKVVSAMAVIVRLFYRNQ